MSPPLSALNRPDRSAPKGVGRFLFLIGVRAARGVDQYEERTANMFENKIYTGIGSRETPKNVQEDMMRVAHNLGYHGWKLRSGHAPGADKAFEVGCKMVGGDMEIYLPWDGFEGAKADGEQYYCHLPRVIQEEARRIASLFHPNWEACSEGAKKMHTRNVYQVVGYSLDMPSDVVICWTKSGKRGGGTGQALRVAEYLKIPIFDLAVHTTQQLQDFLNTGVLP